MSNPLGLTAGEQYVVVTEFIDFDRVVHPPGETWTFISTNFLPYDDGLTLHVSQKGLFQVYRLQWREEEQQEIIEDFLRYVKRTG